MRYPGAFPSPSEQAPYADMGTTQEWVQAQTQTEANPNAFDFGAYDALHAPQLQQPIHGQNVFALQLAQQWQNNQRCVALGHFLYCYLTQSHIA